MSHIHTVEGASIYVVGDQEAFLGCFAHRVDDSDALTEERWNSFASRMYELGLEPIEDEPHFTVTEGDVTYDHYMLRDIKP